jgi:mannose-6-phosphate isomerase-like protein (cupin superfamily)
MGNANLYKQPIHLGLNAVALVQPEFPGAQFSGMEWYEAYAERTAADGAEGRLVSMHQFSGDWDSWEMHPMGDEVVICIDGTITVHQEMSNGQIATVQLSKGDFVINSRGVWHTADIDSSAAVLFITAGMGTENRLR